MGSWIPGFLGSWIPGLLGSWIPVFLGSWLLSTGLMGHPLTEEVSHRELTGTIDDLARGPGLKLEAGNDTIEDKLEIKVNNNLSRTTSSQ